MAAGAAAARAAAATDVRRAAASSSRTRSASSSRPSSRSSKGRSGKAIIEAIATARGHGDLSENFEYHAAKNEQGLLERRITILRSRLQHAEVIDEDAAAASGVVTVGATVELSARTAS